MLFVGLDVIGGYVTEINVTSPTGIRELDKQFGIDIGELLIQAIERRLAAPAASLDAHARQLRFAHGIDELLRLREGRAPVRDRLLVMLFLAALLHGLIILGLTFNASRGTRAQRARAGGAAGLGRAARSRTRNDTATYLAQRTQLGSGNTREAVAPRNRAARVPIPQQAGADRGRLRWPRRATWPAAAEERVLTTTGWNTQVRYLADDRRARGRRPDRPLLLDAAARPSSRARGRPGPAELRGPKRDELWVTPDTRAATLAPYLDAWRRKVERIGTLNYPTAAARRAAPTGNPVHRGRHPRRRHARQGRSSAARAATPSSIRRRSQILKLASPFDPFPPELARQYRVLRFAYEWQFVGGRVRARQRFLELAAVSHTEAWAASTLTALHTRQPACGERRSSLTNHLLIAMPTLADPNFAQTVTLICEHTDKGALGIVLNKPLPMKLVRSAVADEARARERRASPRSRCCAAARCTPTAASCCTGRAASGITPTRSPTTIQVTTSRDVLAAMARGEGPVGCVHRPRLRRLGSGQLEREMRDNAWLSVPVDARVVFDLPFEERWAGAWRLLGIDVGAG